MKTIEEFKEFYESASKRVHEVFLKVAAGLEKEK